MCEVFSFIICSYFLTTSIFGGLSPVMDKTLCSTRISCVGRVYDHTEEKYFCLFGSLNKLNRPTTIGLLILRARFDFCNSVLALR